MKKVRLYWKYYSLATLAGLLRTSHLRKAKLLAGMALLGTTLGTSSCSGTQKDNSARTCYQDVADSTINKPEIDTTIIMCYDPAPMPDTNNTNIDGKE